MIQDYNSPYEIKENEDGTFTIYFQTETETVAKVMTREELEEFTTDLAEAISKLKPE